ncbi:MAG: phospholipase, partial [Chitinophagaceae bacterium]
MKKYFIFLILFYSLSIVAKAQDNSMYEKHWYVHKGDTMPYRLLLPENYDPAKKYPLILFLHGAGERGNDNELQLVHGSKLFL